MIHLQSEKHSDQVLSALQNKNGDGCDILLIGKDNVSSKCDSLWLLSPLVRSIIDSLGNIRDNTIILPDFSYDDIKIGLEITEGNRGEVLMFNSSTKHLLETLGMDLRNSWTGGDDSMSSADLNLEIRTENTDDLPDSNDDDEDDIQKLLLAQNSDFDSSDDEDTDQSDVTVDEIIQNLKVKLEKTDVAEEGMNEDHDDDNDDDEDIQDQLIKDQDLSDSDDDDDDDDNMVSPLQNDNLMDSTEKVEEFLENQLIQETLMMDQDISDDEEEEGADPSDVSTTQGEKESDSDKNRDSEENNSYINNISDDEEEGADSFNDTRTVPLKEGTGTEENNQGEMSDLQKQKLKEVEELLVAENGRWKCKTCCRTFRKRDQVRKHAEIHVTGLSFPCKLCSKIFTTRMRLASHKHLNHRGDIKKTCIRKPETKQNIRRSTTETMTTLVQNKQNNKKAEEVDNLLLRVGDLWKCKICDKTSPYRKKSKLRDHAEIHVEGLSYQCQHCSRIFPTKRRLWDHNSKIHNNFKSTTDNGHI